MSLSRLPQVALRRLMPALTAVPKSLDDDQLKKILDPQQQQQQQQSLSVKGSLPPKSEFAGITSATQGIISALAKSSAALTSPVLSRILTNLSGSQGVLSAQDLVLLRAASNTSSSFEGQAAINELTAGLPQENGSLLTTPEPASPAVEPLLLDQEPGTGALDSASVDALVSALQGTVAISSMGGASGTSTAVSDNDSMDVGLSAAASVSSSASAETITSRRRATGAASKKSTPQHLSALEEHNALAEEADSMSTAASEHSDDDFPPISANLSAAERRKEQNRRAQKKFRQKDKVRQKEVKWRASQYEDLVATNKRFKKDIDAITRERDMYRRMLDLHGIQLGDEVKTGSSSSSAAILSPSPATSLVAVPGLPLSTATRSSSIASSVTAASPALSPTNTIGMEQIAQDTFGTLPNLSAMNPSALSMLCLLSSITNGAVKADPMFGTSGIPTLPSAQKQTDASQIASALAGVSGTSSMATSRTNTSNATTVSSSIDIDSAISALTSSVQSVPAVSAVGSRFPPLVSSNSASTGLWFDGVTSSSDPLLIESPLMVDQNNIDAQYAQQSTIDGQFVDPMSFIDELLASPGFASSSSMASSLPTGSSSGSVVRKRSYDEAMY
ncbi:hypothetical protein GGI25_005925 [Coemansia spiralis]|uniref:BZIP domain-containing protein n=2 Tax=Coemansia TaxID=4863 RepID=A0A9W8G3M2_9FUNG|nr:hypothetical protein BX070DRAFT_141450 [Coemansia spiralis]KAJ1987240.1 hypothetical protein EDC05_005938 [Coemansia umbellata]KAJ2619169.1 hypothetical protein GGI26_006043 [Coemansia sp. RSA 1358]KAJ2670205.1 hypothetical protein GGI25_005925 [Coemansia spiralis]